MQEIYAIGTDDENYRSFVCMPGDLAPTYTPGRRCLREWRTPTVRDYRATGRTYEIGDVSGYFYPAFTAESQRGIAPLLGQSAEWLPVVHEDGSRHFCLNVVEVRPYFLPRGSECVYFSRDSRLIVDVRRYCFARKPRIYEKPLLFTCPGIGFALLATRPMADLISGLNLRGLTVERVWSA